MSDPGADAAVTQGTLLGGLVTYAQPRLGYRTGIEPVLLAASVPARPGERVLEGGTGAGAGLLCLAARVAGISGLGLEMNEGLAALARGNLAAGGRDGFAVAVTDVTGWKADAVYDHAFANPPWHGEHGTASPDRGRDLAKRASSGLLAAWAGALAAGLRRRGTLSFILPAAGFGEGVAALRAARCPEITLWPFWKRPGEAARLVILRGVRNGRGGCLVLPGMALHSQGSAFSEGVEDVLRRPVALPRATGGNA